MHDITAEGRSGVHTEDDMTPRARACAHSRSQPLQPTRRIRLTRVNSVTKAPSIFRTSPVRFGPSSIVLSRVLKTALHPGAGNIIIYYASFCCTHLVSMPAVSFHRYPFSTRTNSSKRSSDVKDKPLKASNHSIMFCKQCNERFIKCDTTNVGCLLTLHIKLNCFLYSISR